MKRNLIIFFVVTAQLLTSCSAYSNLSRNISCDKEEVNIYLQELDAIYQKWDAIEIDKSITKAIDDSRYSSNSGTLQVLAVQATLANETSEMPDILEEARKLIPPDCAIYLHDLALVSMHTKELAVLSATGLLKEDNKLSTGYRIDISNNARDLFDSELEAFMDDPISAFNEANDFSNSISINNNEPFSLPAGWEDKTFARLNDVSISVPLESKIDISDDNGFSFYLSEDNRLMATVSSFQNGQSLVSQYYDTDMARIFMVQELIAATHRPSPVEISTYANNRVYFSEMSLPVWNGVNKRIWSVIITPDGRDILLLFQTNEDEFRSEDRVIFELLASSIQVIKEE